MFCHLDMFYIFAHYTKHDQVSNDTPWANTINSIYMGASKNNGTPKWMVYNGNPIKMDDLGVPLFLEIPIYIYIYFQLYSYFPYLVGASTTPSLLQCFARHLYTRDILDIQAAHDCSSRSRYALSPVLQV